MPWEPLLPTLGFEIVGVDVVALFDIGNELADVLTIFDRRIAGRNILERDLVADRHIGIGVKLEARIVMRDDTQHLSSSRQAFDNNNADIVCVIMNQ
jgi:hypothetical protein